MNRPRIPRLLRFGWSVGWAIVCLLLIALCVRSYWGISYQVLWHGQYVTAERGQLHIDKVFWVAPVLRAESAKLWPYLFDRGEYRGNLVNTIGDGTVLPLWLVLLPLTALAIAPWIRWRFSLRTLLIVVTLVAVVLGVIVCVR